MTSYRVVQWATGNIGTRSLRTAIEHPQLDLVGVYVHSPDKAGRDAGELCGLWTYTPTRSSCGCSITVRSDRVPMLPVAHCTTR